MAFENLTLREKVCQIMAPRVKDYEDYIDKSKKYPVGFMFVDVPDYNIDEKTGICRFDKVLNSIESKIPVCIAADGVTGFGGVTATLKKMRLGAANDEELAYNCGKAYAMQLIYNKVDWSFEPACDLTSHPMSVMASDSFGNIPELTASMASAFVKGMQSVNVAATTKHFPGLGSVPVNPHWTRAKNLMSMEEWENTEGYVYKKTIEAGVAAIMTSHISFPAACTKKDENGKYPIATVSYEITTKLLKEKLRFKGVVVTDAITMGGCECSDTLKVTVESFEAGSDVILFANLDAIDVITEKLEKGEIPMSRLEDALERIYNLKKMTGVLDGKRNTDCLDEEFVRRIHKEEVRKGIALKASADAVFPIDKNKVKKLCVVGINCGGNPDFTPFVKRLENAGFIVEFMDDIWLKNEKHTKEFESEYDLIIFAFAGGSSVPIIPGEIGHAAIWSLNRINPYKRYVVQFGLPRLYDMYFSDEKVYLNTFDSPTASSEVTDNLVKVLVGERIPTGILPYNYDLDENI